MNSCTRARKAKAHAEYSEANRTVRRSIRADKMSYMEALVAEAEVAAHHCNMKDLCTNIKKLSGKFSQPERPVKDKKGKKIPDVEGQKRRWVEHKMTCLYDVPSKYQGQDLQLHGEACFMEQKPGEQQ